MNTPTLEERAYIAAFLDGEGSLESLLSDTVTIPKPVITFTNTNKPILEWIQSFVGGSLAPTKGNSMTTKQCYILRIGGLTDILRCAEFILPYVRRRRNKLMILLEMSRYMIEGNSKSKTDNVSRLMRIKLHQMFHAEVED